MSIPSRCTSGNGKAVPPRASLATCNLAEASKKQHPLPSQKKSVICNMSSVKGSLRYITYHNVFFLSSQCLPCQIATPKFWGPISLALSSVGWSHGSSNHSPPACLPIHNLFLSQMFSFTQKNLSPSWRGANTVVFYLVANSRRVFCSWEFKAKGLGSRRYFKAPLPIDFAELPFLRWNVKAVSSSIPLLKKKMNQLKYLRNCNT